MFRVVNAMILVPLCQRPLLPSFHTWMACKHDTGVGDVDIDVSSASRKCRADGIAGWQGRKGNIH